MSDDVPTSAGSPEHDAWLREALRHAPDAAAAPPLSLRNAILAEARAATRAAPRSGPSISLVDRFAEFWSWFARPPVAAGFASIMAATLVGLMWWDRPMDEAMPQPPSPSVAAAPTPKQVPATQAPAPATLTAATATRTTALPAAPTAPAAPAATAATTATTMSAAPPAPAMPAAAMRADAPQPASPIARAAPEAKLERAQRGALSPAGEAPAERDAGSPEKIAPAADALRETSKDVPTPALKAAPAAAPVPFPARDRSDQDAQAVPARPEPPALAKRAEKSDREEKKEMASSDNRVAAAPSIRDAAPTGPLGRSAGASLDAGASGRLTEQAQPAPAARQRSAAQMVAPTRPMAPLLAALANESERWSRSASAGESVAVDAAVQNWLARVDAAASQWSLIAERSSRRDAALASTVAASALALNRSGRLAAIVKIEDGGVVFEPRPGSTWFAPLAPDVVARLRATLPAAAR